jgi:transposase
VGGDKRNVYRISVGKLEGKRPLGRPRCRGVDNIKIDRREIGWDGVEWIDMARDRENWRALVNTAIKYWKVHEWRHYWRVLKKCSTP